jgi:hypothetical protein
MTLKILSSHARSAKTSCHQTTKNQSSQNQNPQDPSEFQEIAADLCSRGGQDYLVLVDCCTDWPDIIPVGHIQYLGITPHQDYQTVRTGVPDTLWSDQGPQVYLQAISRLHQTMGLSALHIIDHLDTLRAMGRLKPL